MTVTDTGAASPENSRRLALPFERLGAEPTEIEGTGIGLALSRALAEAMGGQADRDQRPRAKGSTFTVTLPRTPDMVQAAQTHGTAPVPVPRTAAR